MASWGFSFVDWIRLLLYAVFYIHLWLINQSLFASISARRRICRICLASVDVPYHKINHYILPQGLIPTYSSTVVIPPAYHTAERTVARTNPSQKCHLHPHAHTHTPPSALFPGIPTFSSSTGGLACTFRVSSSPRISPNYRWYHNNKATHNT